MRHHPPAIFLCAVLTLPTTGFAQTTLTWVGGNAGNVFSESSNWNPNFTVTGDIGGANLIFGDGANSFAPLIDANVTNIGDVTFNSASIYRPDVTNGFSLNFADGATIAVPGNNALLDVPVDTSGSLMLNATIGGLVFERSLTLGGTLTVDGAGDTTFRAPLAGAGDLIKNGSGTLNVHSFSGVATRTGDTTINDGQLVIRGQVGDDVLDDAGVVRVNGDGQLFMVFPETIGALDGSSANATVSFTQAPLVLGGTGVGIGTGTGQSFSFDGSFLQGKGVGTLVIDMGSDTQALNGANAHNGGTTLTSGTLLAGHDNTLGTGDFTVNGGTFGAAGGPRAIANNVILNNDFNINGNEDLTLNGIISGNFGIMKNGAGTLILSGNNTFTGNTDVNTGLLDLRGSVVGNVNVNAGGRLTGDGNIGGSLNFAPGTTFDVEINKGAATEVNQINVANSLTLGNGTIINVTSIGNALVNGDTFTIITTGAGITDLGAVVNAAGLPRITGQINGNDFDLLVQSFTDLTRDSINPGLGVALDRFSDDNPGSAFITALNGLSVEELNTFVRQVNDGVRTPGVLLNLSNESTQAFNNLLSQYLAAARNGTRQFAMQSGTSSYLSDQPGGTMLASLDLSPAVFSHVLETMYAVEGEGEEAADNTYEPLLPDRPAEWSVYVKTYGVFSDQDAGTNRTGYQADAFGFQAGIDRQFNGQWIAGLAFGYTNTQADFTGGLGDMDVDSLRIGPYATYKGDGGRWFVDLAATYGHHRNDSHRTGIATSADADFTSHDLTLYVGGGYNFSPLPHLRVTPTASLQYQYFYRDDYTETGTGAVTVGSDDTNTLYSRVGVQIAYRFDIGGIILVPEVVVGWEHEFLDEDESLESSFVGGGSFAVQTAAPESDSVYFGAGLTAQLNHTTNIFVRYEGTANSSGNVHGITAGLRLWF